MSRFYSPQGDPMIQIPTKDGKRLKQATIVDAKANGWYASVSTISGIVKESDFLTAWKVSQHLDAAKGTEKLLGQNHEIWKQRVRSDAEKAMSRAPELGTAVHNVVEQYQRIRTLGGDFNDIKVDRKDLMPYLAAIHEFSETHGIKARDKDSLEKRIVIPEARTAGTCDFIGQFGKHKVAVLDWKTQKVRKEPWYYFNFPLQLAAYWRGMGGKGQIISVIIDTSGHDSYSVKKRQLPQISFKIYERPLDWYNHFLDLSKIYYLMNNWPHKED